MKDKILPFLFPAFFLAIKIPFIQIRLSDTTIYYYTAHQLLNGKLLYKDIFFTNFPLFPYIASFYYVLTLGNPILFYVTALLEVCAIALVLFFIVKRITHSLFLATFSAMLYLFSFITLAPSDHQTGVFLASLFAILAYYFLMTKKYILVGVFLGFAFLTKAYILPIVLSFFIYLLLQKQYKQIIPVFCSFLISTIFILLPTLLLSPKEFMTDVFFYSLTRSAGLNKGEIIWFFMTHDIVLFFLLLFNLFTIRQHLFFGLISVSTILFFFLYQDIYYLYLHILAPFLCLSFYNFYHFAKKTLQFHLLVLPSLITLFLCANIYLYLSSYTSLQTYESLPSIIATIEKEKPSILYGTNDTTPIFAYLTHTPLLNGIVDTNENIFRKGFLNADTLTNDAIEKKAMVITHGLYYPQSTIDEPIVDGIVNKKTLLEKCKQVGSFPITTEGITNRLSLFRCY